MGMMKTLSKLLLLSFIISGLFCPVFAQVTYETEFKSISSLLQSDLSLAEKKIHELEIQIGDMTSHQKAIFFLVSGHAAVFKGEYNKAVSLLSKAQLLTLDKLLLSKIYGLQVTTYLSTRQYTNSFKAAKNSLSTIDFISDKKIKRETYIRLSGVFNDLNAHQWARKYASEALLIANNKAEIACSAKIYLAVSDLKQNDFQSSYSGFEQSKKYCEKNELYLLATIALKGMGHSKLESKDYINAKELLKEALKGYKEFQYQLELVHTHSLLAKTNYFLNNFSSALKHSSVVVSQQEKPAFYEAKHNAHQTLSKIYHAQGQGKIANAF
ncbi:hypothetical protein [Parashewanella spongiae]|nr:hypothetical protein [Parashewanella spongiae]